MEIHDRADERKTSDDEWQDWPASVSRNDADSVSESDTNPEQLRLTIEARKEKAKELIDAGMSQRETAKVLGTSVATINRDLALQNETETVSECNGDLAPAPERAAYETRKELGHTVEARASVLRFFVDAYPRAFTADQVASEMGLTVLTAGPRVSELHRAGLLERVPERGKDLSGMTAGCWRATREALAESDNA